MILGSDIMNEIIKTYLYSNNYFLMVRYTGNEIDNNIISRELDNKYSRKIELSTFDILSLIEGISSNIKDLKITIVYNDDVVSILEIKNNKITKYYIKVVKDNINIELSYSNRIGFRVNISSRNILDINNILITDIINNELELLSNYSKRAKEHKTLIKTNDKKKKM
ncbi:unknown [Clostridium sp. CAG:302]|nr:unknown [Clostridium sp. CAG:302]